MPFTAMIAIACDNQKGFAMPEYLDLTPDWAPLIPPLCEVLKDPEVDEETKRTIESEFMRLARAMDKRNHANRKKREEASCTD